MIKFYISNNPEVLDTLNCTHTVEAEYGQTVVIGSVATYAHHGARHSNPPPCLVDIDKCAEATVGLSHLDLDALGACMAILGEKPDTPSFWALAGFVDLNGINKLHQYQASNEDLDRLNAWFAWSSVNKLYAPKDGSAIDCTSEVVRASYTLNKIIKGDDKLLENGRNWAKGQAELDDKTFFARVGDVVVRKSEEFVNHLYRGCKGCVALRYRTNSITISLDDAIDGVDCSEIAKSLWGEKAGGHKGIADSPRDYTATEDDLMRAAITLNQVISRVLSTKETASVLAKEE